MIPLLNRFAIRARWKGYLAAWLAGLYLTLAVPVSLPGGAVERVQRNLANLNPGILLTHELGALLLVALFGALLGAGLYALVIFLANWQPKPAAPPVRWRWVLYALPMVAVWALYLLAFWPAMMAPDSINQWTQASTGVYETGHPLLHTLYLWLLMQVGKTPTFVALVQVILLAVVTAWGLGELRRCGLPNWAAWGMAALFALSPVNGTMSITIWKDTPYSTGVFALSLMMLTIALDEQRWLRQKWIALLLGLLLISVGLFRHNGMIIVPVVLLAWLVVYRRYWKVFAAAGAVFLLAFGIVQGPLHSLLRVRESSIIAATIPLHHLAAHLKAGTQPSEAERALLEQVMPLNRWVYDCYNVNLLQGDPTLNDSAAVAETGDLYRLMLDYFLRSPTVDINHTLCAGSLVYRVKLADEGYMLTAQLAYFPEQGGYNYIPDNTLGFREAPVLPGLHQRLADFVTWTSYRQNHWLWWRPATYLYLLLFAGVVLMVRGRSWKLGLFLLPALAQSAGLFLTNISQSFRYQYPVYLIGLFALVLLFLPAGKRTAK